jgi:hypothetical protein
MEPEHLIRIGGIYHFGCAVLHGFFPKALHWEEDLAAVSQINRIVYWILSKLLMYAYAAVGFGSIWFASEISNGRGGHYVLVSISGFWLVRAFFQVRFFREFDEFLGSRAYNVAILSVWLLGAGLYAAPLLCDFA